MVIHTELPRFAVTDDAVKDTAKLIHDTTWRMEILDRYSRMRITWAIAEVFQFQGDFALDQLLVSGYRNEKLDNEACEATLFGLAPGIVLYWPTFEKSLCAGLIVSAENRRIPYEVKVFGNDRGLKGHVYFWYPREERSLHNVTWGCGPDGGGLVFTDARWREMKAWLDRHL